MVDDKWDTTPLIGAELEEIKVRDNEFILRFKNGRTLTGLLSIAVTETAIKPKLELICGYHNG